MLADLKMGMDAMGQTTIFLYRQMRLSPHVDYPVTISGARHAPVILINIDTVTFSMLPDELRTGRPIKVGAICILDRDAPPLPLVAPAAPPLPQNKPTTQQKQTTQ